MEVVLDYLEPGVYEYGVGVSPVLGVKVRLVHMQSPSDILPYLIILLFHFKTVLATSEMGFIREVIQNVSAVLQNDVEKVDHREHH